MLCYDNIFNAEVYVPDATTGQTATTMAQTTLPITAMTTTMPHVTPQSINYKFIFFIAIISPHLLCFHKVRSIKLILTPVLI